jgi:6-phosphogluconolactonase (cycloisomerase 2 family)
VWQSIDFIPLVKLDAITLLFAAGSETDRLASYRVNSETGALTPLETYPVGKRPMWVLMTHLGG